MRTPSAGPVAARAAVSTVAGHGELLLRTVDARRAACAGDRARLRRELAALAPELLAHFDEENAFVERMPSFTAKLLRRGRERVLDQLVELDLEAAHAAGDPCRCAAVAAELDALVRLQALHEHRAGVGALRGHGADRTEGRTTHHEERGTP